MFKFFKRQREAPKPDVPQEEIPQEEIPQEIPQKDAVEEPAPEVAPVVEEPPSPPPIVEEPVIEAPVIEPPMIEAPVIEAPAVPAQTEAPRKEGFFRRLTSVFTGRKIDEAVLEDLEEQLLMSDVSLDTTQVLIEALREAARRGQVPNDAAALGVLQEQIAGMLSQEVEPLQWSPNGITTWLFVGVNGVGKTTTIGKLAHRLAGEGHRPLLVAGDTFRAAATEQLQEWGRRAGCPVIAQQQGADPAAVVYDALSAAKGRNCDIVLIDTAGRLHTKSNLMNELGKIARIIERELGHPPEETLLVIDASTGQNGLTQAQVFTGTAPLSGLVLTKWDGTAKGGIILTIAREAGVPVKLVGVGEKAGDLLPFSAQEFAREMFS